MNWTRPAGELRSYRGVVRLCVCCSYEAFRSSVSTISILQGVVLRPRFEVVVAAFRRQELQREPCLRAAAAATSTQGLPFAFRSACSTHVICGHDYGLLTFDR